MTNSFSCGGKVFSSGHPLIIAELGTSHKGKLEKAFNMIDAVADSGCDAVKVQIVYADEILHPKSGKVKLPCGDVLLYERFKELEAPLSFYKKIREYAHKKRLMFSASVFGMKSLKDLFALSPEFFKLASPELNHYPLIREMAKKDVPIVLSTGVSRLADIEYAISEIRRVNEGLPLAILHCITSYPAPEREYNVSVIENLSRIFSIPTGLSDHSLHPFFIPLLSLAFSSCIIEKHLCLSKNEDGLDDKIALEPNDFSLMCKVLRKMEGQNKDAIIQSLLNEGFSRDRIEKAIGEGDKRLARSEEQNYDRTNRSLHYVRDLKKGCILKKDDVLIVRTEKVLSVGLSPKFYDVVLGAVLQKDVKGGEGISFDDIIARGDEDER